MADKTGIAWTEATWNAVTGCTKDAVAAGRDVAASPRETGP